MFDFDSFYHNDIRTATGKWSDFPAYNFIGGHNDASMVPVDALRESADRVMTEHGRRLATYNLGDGPLGLQSLREFIGSTLAERADMPTDPDNILLQKNYFIEKKFKKDKGLANTDSKFMLNGISLSKEYIQSFDSCGEIYLRNIFYV